MKIWLDVKSNPPSEEYIATESVAEAGLWIVLGEVLRDTAKADNDIRGKRKWKIEEVSIPNDKQIIGDMCAWLIESNRSLPVCVH